MLNEHRTETVQDKTRGYHQQNQQRKRQSEKTNGEINLESLHPAPALTVPKVALIF